MDTPSIFLGLGGTGSQVVAQIKRKIHRAAALAGQDPGENFRFLVIDRAAPSSPEREGLQRDEILRPAGHTRLDVVNMRKTTPGIASWYPPGYDCGDCTNGYNGIRINGRMGLFRDLSGADDGRILSGVTDALRKARSARRVLAGRGLDGTDAVIYVVGSVAGGTGAGLLVDLGFLLRSQTEQNIAMYGIFFLPEAVKRRSSAPYLDGNAYATLRELNWYMDQHGPESNRTIPYRMDFGRRTVDERTSPRPGPYDGVFLVSDHTDSGTTVASWHKIVRITADAVFGFAVAGQGTEFIVNRPPVPMTVPVTGERRPTNFGSLGAFTLRVPVGQVGEFLWRDVATDILSEFVIGEPGAEPRAVGRSEKLLYDPEHPIARKELMGKLRKSVELPVFSHTRNMAALAPGISSVKEWLAESRSVTERHIREVAGGALAESLNERWLGVREALEKELKEILENDDPRGTLGEACSLLRKLRQYAAGELGHLEAGRETQGIRDEYNRLRRQVRELLDGDSEEILALEAELNGVLAKLLPFKREDVRDDVMAVHGRIVNALMDAAMLEEMENFYHRLLDYSRTLEDSYRSAQKAAKRFKDRHEAKTIDKYLASHDDDPEAAGWFENVLEDPQELLALCRGALTYHSQEQSEREQVVTEMLRPVVARLARASRELSQGLFGGAAARQEYLERARSLMDRHLGEQILESVGGRIKEELNNRVSFGEAVVHRARMEGKGGSHVVAYVKDLMGNLANTSSMMAGARVLKTVQSFRLGNFRHVKEVTLDVEDFNAAIRRESQAENFDLAEAGEQLELRVIHSRGVGRHRLVALEWCYGMPLHGLNHVATYRRGYDALENEWLTVSRPRQIDRRMEDPVGTPEYELPLIELLGEEHDGHVFLFLLAMQDWWNEGGNGFSPPLKVNAQAYYTWGADGRRDGRKGREHAQLAFVEDQQNVREPIVRMLRQRWNHARSDQEKRGKLEELRNSLVKLSEDTRYPSLRRTYQREIKIIAERLDRGAYDL